MTLITVYRAVNGRFTRPRFPLPHTWVLWGVLGVGRVLNGVVGFCRVLKSVLGCCRVLKGGWDEG